MEKIMEACRANGLEFTIKYDSQMCLWTFIFEKSDFMYQTILTKDEYDHMQEALPGGGLNYYLQSIADAAVHKLKWTRRINLEKQFIEYNIQLAKEKENNE